ncbi:MAG: hypothetical protein A2149_05670 [Candidatus Schekmanbacteria bacterium RBG_16_38_11]|uniref:Uncharacterized protein n=1 Tax=Candidatus Schekmanbacteria bacterium RBG_16_38_11 TaxID=1817880 RepID=A0A1F7RYM9_9BACT|nr:MAG: hypothetical protein A2149_05670 [Candidatus Schekmanbacteria bacterium RBG_16_38_11]
MKNVLLAVHVVRVALRELSLQVKQYILLIRLSVLTVVLAPRFVLWTHVKLKVLEDGGDY